MEAAIGAMAAVLEGLTSVAGATVGAAAATTTTTTTTGATTTTSTIAATATTTTATIAIGALSTAASSSAAAISSAAAASSSIAAGLPAGSVGAVLEQLSPLSAPSSPKPPPPTTVVLTLPPLLSIPLLSISLIALIRSLSSLARWHPVAFVFTVAVALLHVVLIAGLVFLPSMAATDAILHSPLVDLDQSPNYRVDPLLGFLGGGGAAIIPHVNQNGTYVPVGEEFQAWCTLQAYTIHWVSMVPFTCLIGYIIWFFLKKMLYPAPGEARKYAENISNAISLGSLYYQCLALPGEASYVPDAYCKTWTSDFALVICAALLTIFMLVFTLGLSEYDLRFWQPLLRIHALLVIAFEFAIDPNFYVFGNPMGVGWVRYFLIRIGSPILSAVFLATSLNMWSEYRNRSLAQTLPATAFELVFLRVAPERRWTTFIRLAAAPFASYVLARSVFTAFLQDLPSRLNRGKLIHVALALSSIAGFACDARNIVW